MRKKATVPVRRFLDDKREVKTVHTGIMPLWTIEGVCTHLEVTPGTVRGWIYRRTIPHFKIGRVIRFREADVMQWYEGLKRGGQ